MVGNQQVRRLTKRIFNWAADSLDLVLPRCCPGCNAPQAEGEHYGDGVLLASASFCPECMLQFTESRPRCRACGQELATGAVPIRTETSSCAFCQQHPLGLDRVFVCGPYDGPLREWTIRSKHARSTALCVALGTAAAMKFQDDLQGVSYDGVAPTPSHWLRKLVRGGDSVDIIASKLAMELKVAKTPLVFRKRPTRFQAGLTRASRGRNVRGAFGSRHGCIRAGGRYLIVDDIMTSGATCREIARILRAAGAKQVDALVICRADL